MKSTIKLSMVTLSLLMVAGCMTPEVNLGSKQTTQMKKTNYSQALRSANDMISIFNGNKIHIKVNNIDDAATMGGKLPVKLDTIVNKSFNKIGNSVVVMQNYNPKSLPKNTYLINGSITEFDVIEQDAMSADGAAQGTYNGHQGEFNGGLSKGNKTTKLTLTFNPSNPSDGNYISRTSTDNTITIEQKNSAS